MAGITLSDAETMLALYNTALQAVLKGQAYEIAGRTFRRADMKDIEDGIFRWSRLCQTLSENAEGGYIQSQATIHDTH